jgi:hypothetical protein
MSATRAAPDSSLRNASSAEVSSTNASATATPVPTPVGEQAPHLALPAGTAESGDRVLGDRDDAHRVSVDHPLNHGLRLDLQSLPDF